MHYFVKVCNVLCMKFVCIIGFYYKNKTDLPCSVRVFLLALIIDFIIDGFIIGCEGIVMSIALLPHEFVHVLGDVVFLLSHGLGKKESVILRLLCQLATPIMCCIVKFSQEHYKETLDKMHTYGMCSLFVDPYIY